MTAYQVTTKPGKPPRNVTARLVSLVFYQEQETHRTIQLDMVPIVPGEAAAVTEAAEVVKEDNINAKKDMKSQSTTIQPQPDIPLAEISYNKHVTRFIRKKDNV